MNRCVLRCLLKVFRELAERTVSGRLFHTRAAATPNVRSPTVRSRVRGTISLCVVDDRRRCRELLSAAQCRSLARLLLSTVNADRSASTVYGLLNAIYEFEYAYVEQFTVRCMLYMLYNIHEYQYAYLAKVLNVRAIQPV